METEKALGVLKAFINNISLLCIFQLSFYPQHHGFYIYPSPVDTQVSMGLLAFSYAWNVPGQKLIFLGIKQGTWLGQKMGGGWEVGFGLIWARPGKILHDAMTVLHFVV